MKFTKPLFNDTWDIEITKILISSRKGKLNKMFGDDKNELIKTTQRDGGKPLYLINVKPKQRDYKLAA